MRRVPLLAFLCLGAAADAATIVPPENLGTLAQQAQAVVLARAAGQEVRARGPLLFTHVRFEVLETVKGPGVGFLEVEVPGGSLEVIPNGPLGVYLSVVDGTSQDPVLVLQP